MESNTRAAKSINYYTFGTAAPTIQAMIDAEARRAHAQAQAEMNKEKPNVIKRTRLSEKQKASANYKTGINKKTKQSLSTQQAQQRQKTLLKQETKTGSKARTDPKDKAKTKAKADAEDKPVTGVSVFAILGTIFVSVLMVFVVLAQINFNETAAESVRLNTLIAELTERQRALELAFENAVDIREVERFARDELGMSRPDARQALVLSAAPRDVALVLDSGEDRGLQGFGLFLRSLTDYFRR